jgi:hypothetical protein
LGAPSTTALRIENQPAADAAVNGAVPDET